MAVPSSGTLSLRSLASEVVFDTYNFHPIDGTGISQLGSTSLKDMMTGGGDKSTGSALTNGEFDSINLNSKSSTGTVTTSAATNVSNNQFTMNGSISSYGGLVINIVVPYRMSEFYGYDHDAAAPEKGFVYSSSNSTPTIGASGVIKRVVSGTSTGSYSYNQFTGILSNTTYYYRSYITNRMGTVYGSVVSLTTTSTSSLNSYSLRYNSSKFGESGICSHSNFVTVYSSASSSNDIFIDDEDIFANSSGGSDASSGWYSNGSYYGKWASFGSGGSWTISGSSCNAP
tara:strand:- start:486 stop:1343 length:858 start_codon:yes stop_codon:yes gene_type:complete